MCSTLRTVKFLINASTKLVTRDSIRNFSVSPKSTMRFVQFQLKTGGPKHLGAQIAPEGDVFDISVVDSSIPNDLGKFIVAGVETYNKAKRIVASGNSLVSLQNINILPPLSNPNKIACLGLNYTGHCKEQNIKQPKEPLIFSKFPSTIIGPYDDIHLPPISNSVDWEVELAVIIGRKAKGIRPDQVNDYIFGYTIAQDITARDWQKERNNGQFLLGKTFDTFCPLGPIVVTKNKLDPNNLNIKSWVNGELKQSGNTSEMIFKIDFFVSYLSQICTLMPGDVLLTGTPAGVGMHRQPPQFLKAGDVLESEIDGIGKLRNVVR